MKKQEFTLGISGKKAQLNPVYNPLNTPPIAKKKLVTPIPVKKQSVTTTVPKKIEIKKNITTPKVESLTIRAAEKPESKKNQQKPQKQLVIESPKVQDVIRLVLIRYSHYKEKFEVINNYISFQLIDDKYCISFVFKGNFIPKLKDISTNQYAQKRNKGWLVPGEAYQLQIEEDQIEQSKYEKKTYKAEMSKGPVKTNSKVQQLSNALKGLSVDQLKEKGSKYKELIEQRDLQDILYK